MLCMWCVIALEICRVSSQINHECLRFSKFVEFLHYLVYVGEGCLTLVPSRFPHLRELFLKNCYNVWHKYVKKSQSCCTRTESYRTLRNCEYNKVQTTGNHLHLMHFICGLNRCSAYLARSIKIL